MLTRERVEELKKAKKAYDKINGEVTDRIDEVFTFVHKFFGSTLTNWYFDVAEEGELGSWNIGDLEEGRSIEGIVAEHCGGNKILGELGYEYGFPSKFLFMTDEEITKALQTDLDAYNKRESAQKEKAEAAKQKKAELKAAALSKLTPAERRALKA